MVFDIEYTHQLRKLIMSNTLTITAELAHEIIREKYNLPDNFIIVIDQPTKVEVKQSDDWIYVSSDWHNRYPPQEATNFERIEVEHASGYVNVSAPEDWNISWDQSYADHIVRFRPVNKDD